MTEPLPPLVTSPVARRYVLRVGLGIMTLGILELAGNELAAHSSRLLLMSVCSLSVGALFVLASLIANRSSRRLGR